MAKHNAQKMRARKKGKKMPHAKGEGRNPGRRAAMASLYGSMVAGLTLTPGAGEAAVHYSGTRNVPANPGSPALIDLDGGGQADFAISCLQTGTTYFGTSSCLLHKNAIVGNSFRANFSGGGAIVPARYLASANLPGTAAWSWVSAGFLHKYDFMSSVGEFRQQQGWISVRFLIGGDTHIGWLYYEGTGKSTGVVKQWAYDDDPAAESIHAVDQPTLVDLTAFSAAHQGDSVLVSWETASEVDNAGFHLWRADEIDGTYVRITGSLILAEGSPTQGASYSFTDTGCPDGSCFYKIQDIENNGASSWHGPFSAEKSSTWAVQEAQASQVNAGTAAASRGFSIFSLFFPPAATLLWRMRRNRKKRSRDLK